MLDFKKQIRIYVNLYTVGAVLLVATSFASEVRVALDVGSGGLKYTVAEVNTQSNSIQQIIVRGEISVPLKRDMQVSGKNAFSSEIQKQVFEVVQQLQLDFGKYAVKGWSGIATAASRQASNAQELYTRIEKELGITITVIDQKEEGRLGFETALAVSKMSPDKIIAYDSGSGSFQLTSEIEGKLEVCGGQIGMIPALSALVTEIRAQKLDQKSSPNPVSVPEALALVSLLKTRLPTLSQAFQGKLHDKNSIVIGIGNANYIFAMGATAVGKATYTKQELWTAIEAHCGLPDEALTHFAIPQETLVGMVLLYTVMDGMGIDQLTYAYANGSCEGLLLDPNYWSPILARE